MIHSPLTGVMKAFLLNAPVFLQFQPVQVTEGVFRRSPPAGRGRETWSGGICRSSAVQVRFLRFPVFVAFDASGKAVRSGSVGERPGAAHTSGRPFVKAAFSPGCRAGGALVPMFWLSEGQAKGVTKHGFSPDAVRAGDFQTASAPRVRDGSTAQVYSPLGVYIWRLTGRTSGRPPFFFHGGEIDEGFGRAKN